MIQTEAVAQIIDQTPPLKARLLLLVVECQKIARQFDRVATPKEATDERGSRSHV